MKKYNVQNHVRYKKDLAQSQPSEDVNYNNYTRDELIVKFLPLVENIARKFSTAQQASGVLTISDLIQEGSLGLIAAVDRLDWEKLNESKDLEKTLKSFLSKRIKGAIRRAIDINRGDIKIPEYKLIEFRKNIGKDRLITETFFNSIFLSTDELIASEKNCMLQIPDNSEVYNIDIMNKYLLSIMKRYLLQNEYDILRLSYGLDCEKHSAKEIADILNIEGTSNYVRISELKKIAINKLIESVDPEQVLDFL
jgi:RNA polymerase sigma factor (sigma-70 family)